MFSNVVKFVVAHKSAIIKGISWVATAVGVAGCVKAGADAAKEISEKQKTAPLTGGEKAIIFAKHTWAPVSLVALGTFGTAKGYKINIDDAMKKQADTAAKLAGMTATAKNMKASLDAYKGAVKETLNDETAKKVNDAAAQKFAETVVPINGGIQPLEEAKGPGTKWCVPCIEGVCGTTFWDDKDFTRFKSVLADVQERLNAGMDDSIGYDYVISGLGRKPCAASRMLEFTSQQAMYLGLNLLTSDDLVSAVVIDGVAYKQPTLATEPVVCRYDL